MEQLISMVKEIRLQLSGMECTTPKGNAECDHAFDLAKGLQEALERLAKAETK